jgi:hypothetical protein
MQAIKYNMETLGMVPDGAAPSGMEMELFEEDGEGFELDRAAAMRLSVACQHHCIGRGWMYCCVTVC